MLIASYVGQIGLHRYFFFGYWVMSEILFKEWIILIKTSLDLFSFLQATFLISQKWNPDQYNTIFSHIIALPQIKGQRVTRFIFDRPRQTHDWSLRTLMLSPLVEHLFFVWLNKIFSNRKYSGRFLLHVIPNPYYSRRAFPVQAFCPLSPAAHGLGVAAHQPVD